MLAGIGGRTVAEAKRRMGWSEFQTWMQYRAKHGPLNSQAHIEQAAALVAFMVSSTVPRGKGQQGPKFSDFLPGSAKVEAVDEAPIDLEVAVATWR